MLHYLSHFLRCKPYRKDVDACCRTLMQKVWHAAIWEAVTAGVIALILGILYGTLGASAFHQHRA